MLPPRGGSDCWEVSRGSAKLRLKIEGVKGSERSSSLGVKDISHYYRQPMIEVQSIVSNFFNFSILKVKSFSQKIPMVRIPQGFCYGCSYLLTWNFVTPFLMKSTI